MKPIVIIGAGISGLQAARLLENQGVNYVLIEKSEKIGGRVQTEMVDGYLLDHGFQVLQTAYPEVQRSLDLKNWIYLILGQVLMCIWRANFSLF